MRRALATCLLLLAPAGASADDAGVSAAWDAQDAQFKKLGRETAAENRRWIARGRRRGSKLIRLQRETQKLIDVNSAG
ncbi:MAG: hypothetical protein H0T15_09720 [Thermoleophilaceae bacterium]|nr:hypothetical protein [Thermoleophilaceae bacterium]